MDESAFLIGMPSFLSGMARAFDIGGTFTSYNNSPSPAEADARALAADWAAVGKDLRDAIEVAGPKPSE